MKHSVQEASLGGASGLRHRPGRTVKHQNWAAGVERSDHTGPSVSGSWRCSASGSLASKSAEQTRTHWLAVSAVLAGWLAAVGCDSPESIRRYTVERPPSSHRMLAAIVPQAEQVWFFKATGENAALSQHTAEFERFLRSVRFADGKPTWALPPGWEQLAGDGLRHATLKIASAEPPLELSVTALPKTEAETATYILSNINRWRGQLQLPPLTLAQLADETTEIVLDESANLTATMVVLQGNLAADSAGMPPFASSSPSGNGAPAAPAEEAAEIEYTQPAGWELGQRVVSRGGIRITRAAAFTVGEGDAQAEVTVTSLPTAAADRLANVNRWLRQLGLEPIAPADLNAQSISFDGAAGDYYELIGPEQAILGVIADRGSSAWFIKLQGPHDVAVAERERFKQFVHSIQFKE